MKIRITGARGEIGSWLLGALKRKGLDVGPLSFEEPCGPTTRLLHLAAKRPTASPEEIIDSNINYLRTVVEWAARREIKEFFFFSSNSLYKNLSRENVSESDSLGDLDLYSLTKRAGELYLERAGVASVICLRIPGALEMKRPTALISTIWAKLHQDQPIELTNPDKIFNNYLGLPDLCRFVSEVQPRMPFDIVNLAPSGQWTLRQIVTYLAAKADSKSKITWMPTPAPSFSVSVEKLNRFYGFECSNVQTSFDQWIDEVEF